VTTLPLLPIYLNLPDILQCQFSDNWCEREGVNCCTSVTSRCPATRIIVAASLTPENPKLTVPNAKTTEIQAVGRLVEINSGLVNGHNINLRTTTLATMFIVST
jgi:hypothetical protein